MPSTVIRHFDYAEKSKTLTIIFLSGLIYRYKNVPVEIFKRLKIARSKGGFFNDNIKNKYKFKKLES